MKPELILLAQLFAKVESLSLTTFEQLGYISGKLNDLPSPAIEILTQKLKDDHAAYEQKVLDNLLGILTQSFPESFDTSKSIGELLKRISLS